MHDPVRPSLSPEWKLISTSSKTECHHRRLDIQGLRTIAITAVYGFHLWPETFTCGFLGVDMFFVISGYLMAQILCRNQQTSSSICNFYQRRIRRIVPICLLIINCVLYGGRLWLVSEDFVQLSSDTVTAIAFCTNIRNSLVENDYWDQLTAYRFLLHTWSLGVEVQFYLLAPFLFHFLLKLYDTKERMLMTVIFASISYALKSHLDSTVAFNLVLTRFWQFAFGILAYFYESTARQEGKMAMFFCKMQIPTLCLVLLYPTDQVYQSIAQFLVVLKTAIYLALGSGLKNMALENAVMVKVGDWSYVWYLVHWPVIQFWNYSSISANLSYKDAVTITIVILCLTNIFDFLDKQLRIQLATFKSTMLMICFLYAFSFAFVYQDSGNVKFTPSETKNSTIIDANFARHYLSQINQLPDTAFALKNSLDKSEYIRLNRILANLRPNCTVFSNGDECIYKGNGTKRAILIGNSHALMLYDALAVAFSQHFSFLRLVWNEQCLPILYPSANFHYHCEVFIKAIHNTIEIEKPEIAFINFKWQPSMDRKLTNLNNDIIVQELQNLLGLLSKYASAVFIGEPNLNFKVSVANELAKRLELSIPLDGLSANLVFHYRSRRSAYRRFCAILSQCPICKPLQWSEAFCEQNLCTGFDNRTNLAYFRDYHHWSLHGQYKIERYLRQISGKFKANDSLISMHRNYSFCG